MKYFKANWNAINKVIRECELTDLRAEQNELSKKIQLKINGMLRDKRELEVANKITELKHLPIGSVVHYTGRSGEIKFGATGIKVKDGRLRMIAEFSGKNWGIYYTNLKISEVTANEKISNSITTKITNNLNSIL